MKVFKNSKDNKVTDLQTRVPEDFARVDKSKNKGKKTAETPEKLDCFHPSKDNSKN